MAKNPLTCQGAKSGGGGGSHRLYDPLVAPASRGADRESQCGSGTPDHILKKRHLQPKLANGWVGQPMHLNKHKVLNSSEANHIHTKVRLTDKKTSICPEVGFALGKLYFGPKAWQLGGAGACLLA